MTKKILTKRGAVSIYIVIFLTLIFGVITLSFIRIVLHDATETTNTDLYQSAYDSALAGVEDAKIALLKYHDCLSQGAVGRNGASSGSCAYIIYQMEQGANNDDCDVVQKVLGRSQEDPKDGGQNEVIIEETQNSTDEGNSESLSQAYTCVKITEETDDYLTTLKSSDSIRVIPLRSSEIDKVNSVQLSWYLNDSGESYTNSSASFPSKKFIPPVVSVEIFQTDTKSNVDNCSSTNDPDSPCFTIGDLSANNGYSNSDSRSGTDHALLMLRPVESGGTNFIPAHGAGGVIDHSDKSDNAPINVNCNGGDFACTVTIELPLAFRSTQPAEATRFMRVSIPYEQPDTDISISLCTSRDGDNKCTSYTKFTGVQAAIDSTGRANDLYRRVESRVELVDVYYPFPEYSLFLGGNNNSLSKNFYATSNCQRMDSGNVQPCNDTGAITDESLGS